MSYADPEQIVATWLATNVFPGTGETRVRIVLGEQPPNLQHAQRIVTVVKLPSSPGDAQPTLDVADVELSFFARTRERAKALANVAHPALRYQLEKSTDPATGAFVKQVRALAAPSEAPWESSGEFRWTGTYRLWIHHNPLASS